ncbi:hypothetical protein A2276_06055 [candidate division WOR-1 bacterium RIFOXYA12_FULL_43_27]|uniref:Glutamine--scyllo-inositol aminotransferase n=1 Tax=candidate division WOR-1 bacterium RIFOXYC2_FULL_46_14 TaxID=1802587 RepID=A0A1F4U3F6_UNCSA|nr:MAG: hypothetical protein A2276_06055 [candidate division WOR-1 bacterium RIFOXYA12_FULL_43_27]OGC20221.1 MAG: hypothetical protein A2292_04055 [candidate division WOR-1 bacterium RIFOXYB2_FULL_46_45]OGC32040.1 MAG: hypothetical protein A2232_07390 [candidate division WOR-1 bacterium RIFOXYA2_FULL_46_56]OGC39442.1 MAG: hypothetical protein A2438_07755 [candidate division WOR-1 bacterium RIFOXYC2_FULL_46_14]
MVQKETIRLAKPWLDADEMKEIEAVLASGYLTQGPKVVEFEKLVAKYIGVKEAIATTSATTALHLSLAALNIKAGDEVLVSDFTFPASANVIVQQGAKPILVDIDLDTFTVNIDDLISKVTAKTKAIMPVHAFGLSADMGPILDLAKSKGMQIVEDAACAIGTTYYGKHCGSFGTTGCFSFHPRKVITTGEGGMITTNDNKLAERICLLRNHGGQKRSNQSIFVAAGYNYRLSDVLAAIGIAQMRKLDKIITRKQELAKLYDEKLSKLSEIKVTSVPPWGGQVNQSYVIILSEQIDRDQVIELLKKEDIETTLGTYALHAQPFFQQKFGYKTGQLLNSARAYAQALTLPLYAQMNEVNIERVVKTLKEVILKCKR